MTADRNPNGLVLVAGAGADRTDLDMESTESAAPPPSGSFFVDASLDPRDIWMSASDVHDYLHRGRSQGYAFTGSIQFQSVAALPGVWRLADVRSFFDAKAAAAIAAIQWPAAAAASEEDQQSTSPAARAGAVSGPGRARRADPSGSPAYDFVNVQRRSAKPGAAKRKERQS